MTTTHEPRGRGYRALVRDRVAARLLVASLLVLIGSWLGFGTLFVLAYERAGEQSIGPGLAMTASAVPAVVGGFTLGGVLGRRDRRRTLAQAALLGAAAPPIAILPGLVPVLVSSAGLSLATVAFLLVRTPTMAESVPESLHGPLIGAMSGANHAATILGLGLGSGLAVALGSGASALLLTCSILLAATSVVLRLELAPPTEATGRSGPLVGLRVVLGDPVLRALFFLVVVLVAMAATPETLATAAGGDDPLQVGLLMAIAPAATLAASLWTGRREDLLLDPRFLLGQVALAIPAAMVVGVLGEGLAATLLANVLLGVAIGWTVGAQLVFMRRVPAALLGQVTGTMIAMTTMTEGLGGLVVGAVADATSVRGGYVFIGCLTACGLVALGRPVLLQRRARPEVVTAA